MDEDATQAYRAEELHAALATDPRVSEPELDVTVTGHSVVVRGVVPTEERRIAVAELVRERAPDLDYVDAVEVASRFPRPTSEEAVR